MAVQGVQDRARHRADSHLDHRAVGHQGRDLPRDLFIDLARLARRMLQRRTRAPHDVVDPRHVERLVGVSPRQTIVDLGNHGARSAHRDLQIVVHEPHAVFAAAVSGRAQMEHHDVGLKDAAIEQRLDVGKLARDEA